MASDSTKTLTIALDGPEARQIFDAYNDLVMSGDGMTRYPLLTAMKSDGDNKVWFMDVGDDAIDEAGESLGRAPTNKFMLEFDARDQDAVRREFRTFLSQARRKGMLPDPATSAGKRMQGVLSQVQKGMGGKLVGGAVDEADDVLINRLINESIDRVPGAREHLTRGGQTVDKNIRQFLPPEFRKRLELIEKGVGGNPNLPEFQEQLDIETRRAAQRMIETGDRELEAMTRPRGNTRELPRSAEGPIRPEPTLEEGLAKTERAEMRDINRVRGQMDVERAAARGRGMSQWIEEEATRWNQTLDPEEKARLIAQRERNARSLLLPKGTEELGPRDLPEFTSNYANEQYSSHKGKGRSFVPRRSSDVSATQRVTQDILGNDLMDEWRAISDPNSPMTAEEFNYRWGEEMPRRLRKLRKEGVITNRWQGADDLGLGMKNLQRMSADEQVAALLGNTADDTNLGAYVGRFAGVRGAEDKGPLSLVDKFAQNEKDMAFEAKHGPIGQTAGQTRAAGGRVGSTGTLSGALEDQLDLRPQPSGASSGLSHPWAREMGFDSVNAWEDPEYKAEVRSRVGRNLGFQAGDEEYDAWLRQTARDGDFESVDDMLRTWQSEADSLPDDWGVREYGRVGEVGRPKPGTLVQSLDDPLSTAFVDDAAEGAAAAFDTGGASLGGGRAAGAAGGAAGGPNWNFFGSQSQIPPTADEAWHMNNFLGAQAADAMGTPPPPTAAAGAADDAGRFLPVLASNLDEAAGGAAAAGTASNLMGRGVVNATQGAAAGQAADDLAAQIAAAQGRMGWRPATGRFAAGLTTDAQRLAHGRGGLLNYLRNPAQFVDDAQFLGKEANFIPKSGGQMSRLAFAGKPTQLLTKAGPSLAAGLALEAGINLLDDDTTKDSDWGAAGKGAARGALAGAGLGSIVPGIGTAVGTGVGALAGGLWGYLGNPDPVEQANSDEFLDQLRGGAMGSGTDPVLFQRVMAQAAPQINLLKEKHRAWNPKAWDQLTRPEQEAYNAELEQLQQGIMSQYLGIAGVPAFVPQANPSEDFSRWLGEAQASGAELINSVPAEYRADLVAQQNMLPFLLSQELMQSGYYPQQQPTSTDLLRQQAMSQMMAPAMAGAPGGMAGQMDLDALTASAMSMP